MSNFKWKIFSNFVAFSEYPNFNDKSQKLIAPLLDYYSWGLRHKQVP